VITGKSRFRRAFSDMSRAVFASGCFRWEISGEKQENCGERRKAAPQAA